MGDKFYAVAHGRKPGVYEQWTEVQEQINGFPQPIYKKFTSKDEAEEFVKVRQHESVSMDVDESAKKFYAIARGKVIGIFTDYEEVKKHIADYPQPMYKKFESVDEAKAYFKKQTTAEDAPGGSKSEKEKEVKEEKVKEEEVTDVKEHKEKDHKHKEGHKHEEEHKHKDEDKKHKEKEHKHDEEEHKAKAYYAVARGHKPGVYDTWAECQEQTKDFKGAKFKKFTDRDEAKMFSEGCTLKQIEERKRPHEDDKEGDDEVEHKKPAKEKSSD